MEGRAEGAIQCVMGCSDESIIVSCVLLLLTKGRLLANRACYGSDLHMTPPRVCLHSVIISHPLDCA